MNLIKNVSLHVVYFFWIWCRPNETSFWFLFFFFFLLFLMRVQTTHISNSVERTKNRRNGLTCCILYYVHNSFQLLFHSLYPVVNYSSFISEYKYARKKLTSLLNNNWLKIMNRFLFAFWQIRFSVKRKKFFRWTFIILIRVSASS